MPELGAEQQRDDLVESAPGSDRAALRSQLLAHAPRDLREETSKARILEALEILERPFDRYADPVHLTGSAVVAGSRGTVLHVHRRLGRWMQPGGHLGTGESPPAAALRESEEETGLELSHPAGGPRLIHVDVHPAADGHTHLDLRYLLLAPDEDPSPLPGESTEVRWCTWDEADDLCDAALAGALVAARREPEVAALRHNGGC